ncbi:hypothetical protein RB195_010993 [Necator americanus]|uniref:Mos1 transposase HTH domain-containing protein n=1 Tax=Necator americanus TaxID=51031 RepID=A0ABR1D0F9_NECAM
MLASQAEAPTSKTSTGRDAPALQKSAGPHDSAVKEDPEINTRSLATRLGCSHSTFVIRLQALQKSAGSMDPSHVDSNTLFTRVYIYQSLLFRPHQKEFLKELITGNESWLLGPSKPNRTFTPICVSFVASGIQREHCYMSCSHKATPSPVPYMLVSSRSSHPPFEKNGRDEFRCASVRAITPGPM